MICGTTGTMLSHVRMVKEEKKTSALFSPVPELALFFGMTSAKTDKQQVGFSTGLERCGSVHFRAYSLVRFDYSLPSTSLHGLKTFSGCMKMHYCFGSPA